MSVHLDEPLTAGGNSFVHFFNGRLLTGEDLSREQSANERARRRLGLAIGTGVAAGLEVTPTVGAQPGAPSVTVEAGLAVNQLGQALEVPSRTDVSLVEQPAAVGATPQVVFKDCTPPQPVTYTTGAGVYLLSIRPAEAPDGRAPISGLGNGGAGCNTAYSVDAVQFGLLRLSLPVAAVASDAQLRNRVAHLLLGSDDPVRAAFAADPAGIVPLTYGLLDDLRTSCLGPDEVPLALLRWTGSDGLVFVDRWAVRRRITSLDEAPRWPLLAADRVASDGEASFLQFQDQVDELRDTSAGVASPPSALAAADAFAFLPPVGILPLADVGSPRGFDRDTFFGAQASRDVAFLDGAHLASLVRESFTHDPVVVGSDEKVQLYSVWENANAVAAGAVSQLVVVYAKQTLRLRGSARYGASFWGAGRTAQVVV
jgi:hypothetical protein